MPLSGVVLYFPVEARFACNGSLPVSNGSCSFGGSSRHPNLLIIKEYN